MTASTEARRSWTSARASGEVIHRLVPSAAATRPSRVVAAFHVTNGRPWVTAKVQASLSAAARSASSPPLTSTPAARSRAAPPAATGLGSAWANTTRPTPASTSACAHGPVRPVWLHGSRVTTAVAPRASAPARASASTSACGVPAPRWKPSASTEPSGRSSTQPTRGLGPVGTPGVAASSSARRIASASVVIALTASEVSAPARPGGLGREADTATRDAGTARSRRTATDRARRLPSGL